MTFDNVLLLCFLKVNFVIKQHLYIRKHNFDVVLRCIVVHSSFKTCLVYYSYAYLYVPIKNEF